METKKRVAAIIIEDNKLLMVQGHGSQLWWTPGGKTEGHESDIDCLRRELQEEIGVTLLGAVFFKEYSGISTFNPGQIVIQHIYLTQITGTIKPLAEIENYLWLTKDDKENYLKLMPTEKQIVSDLMQEKIW